jgi:hypothetical protein
MRNVTCILRELQYFLCGQSDVQPEHVIRNSITYITAQKKHIRGLHVHYYKVKGTEENHKSVE